MTPPRVQLSPISRRFRRYKMQCAASAAMAEALKRAPRLEQIAHERYDSFDAKRRATETLAAEAEAMAELDKISETAKALPKPKGKRRPKAS
jgi:hypothetical protein